MNPGAELGASLQRSAGCRKEAMFVCQADRRTHRQRDRQTPRSGLPSLRPCVQPPPAQLPRYNTHTHIHTHTTGAVHRQGSACAGVYRRGWLKTHPACHSCVLSPPHRTPLGKSYCFASSCWHAGIKTTNVVYFDCFEYLEDSWPIRRAGDPSQPFRSN